MKIQKHRVGFGITDGKKWFLYAYVSKETAQNVLKRILSNQMATMCLTLNISYPEPLQLVF